MKKSIFKSYLLIWVVLFAVFSVVSFVVPGFIAEGEAKFDGAFWAGYLLTTLAFVLHIGAAYFAFQADSKEKLFYNMSLVRASYTGLIFMLIFGALAMAVPFVPEWVGVVVCFAIVMFTIVAVAKASAAAEIVEAVDTKVKEQTSFIKMTTVDAQNMVASAKSDAVKAECQKVFEAIRYSDPMSNEALNLENGQITVKMGEMAAAVGADDANKAAALASELIALVQARNNKCKALK